MGGNPLGEEVAEGFQFKEELFAIAHDGFFTANGAVGALQFARIVGGTADFAAVAILVLRVTFRAFTLHKTAGKEHAAVFAIELGHCATRNITLFVQAHIDSLR